MVDINVRPRPKALWVLTSAGIWPVRENGLSNQIYCNCNAANKKSYIGWWNAHAK